MPFTTNYQTRNKDQMDEEKVIHFDDNVIPQHAEISEISTQASQRSTRSEFISSKAKKDFLRKSKILGDGTKELDHNLVPEIGIKGVTTRSSEEDVFEDCVDHNVATCITRFPTLGNEGNFKAKRNQELLVKVHAAKLASIKTQKFDSAEDKRFMEVGQMNKLLFRNERGNRRVKLRRDVCGNLFLSSTSSQAARGKRKSGAENKENLTQQKAKKGSEQLKRIINNLVIAVSYSFQNAHALKQQLGKETDNSFLTFCLRRELRKMFLINELIKELEMIMPNLKGNEDDLKEIGETVESLQCLMRHDLKESEEHTQIAVEDPKNLRLIAVFVIIACAVSVFSLVMVSVGHLSGLGTFIFMSLVLFLIIKTYSFDKLKKLLYTYWRKGI